MQRGSYFSRLDPKNAKTFWKTVKVLTKEKSRIPFLKDDSGNVTFDDAAKATSIPPPCLFLSNLASS